LGIDFSEALLYTADGGNDWVSFCSTRACGKRDKMAIGVGKPFSRTLLKARCEYPTLKHRESDWRTLRAKPAKTEGLFESEHTHTG